MDENMRLKVERVLKVPCGARERVLVEMLTRGWCPMTLCAMRVDQVEEDRGGGVYVRGRAGDDGPTSVYFRPVGAEALRAVRAWVAERRRCDGPGAQLGSSERLLFPGLTPERVAEVLRNVADRAGVPEVTVDAIRSSHLTAAERVARRVLSSLRGPLPSWAPSLPNPAIHDNGPPSGCRSTSPFGVGSRAAGPRRRKVAIR